MFNGKDSEVVGEIASYVMRVKCRYAKEHAFNSIPNIVLYVGSKQYCALRSIEAGDNFSMRINMSKTEERFMDAEVVEVRKDDYLHVVARGE